MPSWLRPAGEILQIKPGKDCRLRALLLDKQRQRSRVTVWKVFFPDRPDLTVTEEASHAESSQRVLHVVRVVVGHAKQLASPPVATAQAAAQDSLSAQPTLLALQERGNVFGAGRGITTLELDGLPDAWQRAHRDGPATPDRRP